MPVVCGYEIEDDMNCDFECNFDASIQYCVWFSINGKPVDMIFKIHVLPRSGETVVMNGEPFTVFDVEHDITTHDGCVSSESVTIHLRKRTKVPITPTKAS
jgi:hypothetical protein